MADEDGQPGSDKLWGGRFSAPTDALVEAYTASIAFDRRLYREDIAGSIAHARMLARQGIIEDADCDAIVEGLRAIEAEIEAGSFEFRDDREDIHLNIEAALAERIGEPARRLHTARSRNDQVATDLRMFVRAACDEAAARLRALRGALIDLAAREAETVVPGYTHLQTRAARAARAPPARLRGDVRARRGAAAAGPRARPTCCRSARAPSPASATRSTASSSHASWASRRSRRTRSTRSPTATSWSTSTRRAALAMTHLSRPLRGDRALGLGRVRPREPRRPPSRPGRASCRRSATRTSPNWRGARARA